jgi:uncharacterized protein (TIGR00251 family)
MEQRPYAAVAGGVRLAVRLKPRASRNGIDGVVTGADGRTALQIRLTARPVEGAANAALVAFLAETLEIRKADIAILSGQTARTKILHLSGDSATIMNKLRA